MCRMTREEQATFVHDILANLEQSILAQISNEDIPEHWNGIQLRQLIADKAAFEIAYVRMQRREKIAYNNEVLIHNLI